MKIKSQRDFWSGLMFLVVGVVFAIGSRNYRLGSSAAPGPGFFPLILSVAMTILGAIIVFKSTTFEVDGGDPIDRVAWRPLLVIVASIVLFAVCIEKLGLALTIPLLIAVSSLAGDEFHWRGTLLNAAVLTLASWLIFIVGLKLNLALWPTFLGR